MHENNNLDKIYMHCLGTYHVLLNLKYIFFNILHFGRWFLKGSWEQTMDRFKW